MGFRCSGWGQMLLFKRPYRSSVCLHHWEHRSSTGRLCAGAGRTPRKPCSSGRGQPRPRYPSVLTPLGAVCSKTRTRVPCSGSRLNTSSMVVQCCSNVAGVPLDSDGEDVERQFSGVVAILGFQHQVLSSIHQSQSSTHDTISTRLPSVHLWASSSGRSSASKCNSGETQGCRAHEEAERTVEEAERTVMDGAGDSEDQGCG